MCTILCVLYCTVLYYTVLYCTVRYCTVLYCTVLYCTVLYCTVHLVRSLFDSVRSLVSRLVITIFVFGFEDTVSAEQLSTRSRPLSSSSYLQMSDIIANADPFSIGDFLFNPTILLITVGRFFAAVRSHDNDGHMMIVEL